MSDNSGYPSGLVTGVVLGGLIGAGLAFFLSPRSGEENRKMVATKALELRDKAMTAHEDITGSVQDIFGEVSAATISLYTDARELLAHNLADFQDNWDDIDKQKYLDMVDNVTAILRKDKKNNPKYIDKLKAYWTKNWRQISANF